MLRALDASAAGTAFVGSAAAGSDDVEVSELSETEAENTITTASDTSAFVELRRALRTDGRTVDKDDATVYYREGPNGSPHHVVEFPVVGTTGAIAVTLRDGSFDSARASVKATEGDLVTVDWYTLENGVSQESVTVDIETMTVEGENGPAQDVSACDACLLIGDVVCAMSCGAAASVICALASIGTIAGTATCGAIMAGFCAALTWANEQVNGHACDSDQGMELACEYAGYC